MHRLAENWIMELCCILSTALGVDFSKNTVLSCNPKPQVQWVNLAYLTDL